jgi:hypothetical protein
MRFVMGVSRVTSAAGKPREHVRLGVASHVPGDPLRTLERKCGGVLESRWLRELRTNVAREHEEVIVRQTTVPLGVNECLDVNAIALLVLVLEHLEGLGVVQGVGGGVDHGVAVLDGHDEYGKDFSGTEKYLQR